MAKPAADPFTEAPHAAGMRRIDGAAGDSPNGIAEAPQQDRSFGDRKAQYADAG